MVMLKERLVSIKTAVMLRDCGFPQVGQYDESPVYNISTKETITYSDYLDELNNGTDSDTFAVAPTITLAVQWLREEFGYFIDIVFNRDSREWDMAWKNILQFGLQSPYKSHVHYDFGLEAEVCDICNRILIPQQCCVNCRFKDCDGHIARELGQRKCNLYKPLIKG